MSRELETAYGVSISVPALERLPLEDVQQTERGTLFVATPQPPRVGTRVQIDVATPGSPDPTRVTAMVVWSRPPRPGVVAGFRGQITEAPDELMEHVRDLASAARMRIEHRESDERRSGLDAPITERIRRREVTAPTHAEPSLTGKVPVGREVTAPQQNAEKTARQLTTNAVRISFSSARTYLLHYQQFLSKSQVYVHNLPAPPVGSSVAIMLDVPDGELPLVLSAQVERTASPPEVPQAGWVGRFSDPGGTIGERLAAASFLATAPGTRSSGRS